MIKLQNASRQQQLLAKTPNIQSKTTFLVWLSPLSDKLEQHYNRKNSLEYNPKHLIAPQELENIFLKLQQWHQDISCYHRA